MKNQNLRKNMLCCKVALLEQHCMGSHSLALRRILMMSAPLEVFSRSFGRKTGTFPAFLVNMAGSTAQL